MKPTRKPRDWRYVPAKPKPVTPSEKKACVVYARVSTGKQEGIDSQLERLNRRASEKGFTVLRTIVAEPERGDASERPTLDELVSFCREHRNEVGHVLVTNFKRAARDNPRWAMVELELRGYAIAVYSVDYDVSTETPQGRHFANQEVSAGALELEELRGKALGAKMRLRRDGCPSFRAPMGYVNDNLDERTPTFLHHADLAPVVNSLFGLIAEGRSVSETLEYAFSAGLRSRQGGRLSRQTMLSILRNPVYAGFMKPGPDGGALIRGNWDPIVTEDLFDAVQQKLDGVARMASRNRAPNPSFPLATVLSCPICSSRISGYSQKGHRYYRCRKDSKHLHTRADSMEGDLVDALSSIALETNGDSMLDSVFTARMKTVRERIGFVERRARRLLRAIEAVEESLVGGKADGTTALSLIEKYRVQQAKVYEDKCRLTEIVTAAERILSESRHLCSRLDLAWDCASAQQRRGLLSRVFPGGLTYDPDTRFPRLREELSPIFRIITEPEVGRSGSQPSNGTTSPPQSSTAGSPRGTRRKRG